MLIRKNLTQYIGNLIKPEGKSKKSQHLNNKIFELAKASPTNLIIQILTLFRLL
ncbi:MAG: Unknown protein [uncultured Sulfurovum sp.]|uniref:Uncharacterized protein n=1 Tax=uncultured Sulfurovum sp. TaxID=269237 RepID=A0A6S6TCV3_9BACT|nr:MAG: Unknown protein [uncultured Sulfurovum sp.]